MFGKGSGKECREQVHRLNDAKRNSDYICKSYVESILNDNETCEFLNEIPNSNSSALSNIAVSNSPKQSKWENFIEKNIDENVTERRELINNKKEYNISKDLHACSSKIKSDLNYIQPKSVDVSGRNTKPLPLLNFHQMKANRSINKQRPVPYHSKSQSSEGNSPSQQLFNYDTTRPKKLSNTEEGSNSSAEIRSTQTAYAIAEAKSVKESPLKKMKTSSNSKWLNYVNENSSNSDNENEFNETVFFE